MAKNEELLNDETVFKNLGGAFSNSFVSDDANDNLVLKRAKVVAVLGPGDDRIQVQILGSNSSIPDDEKDNLPKFPPFFNGTSLPCDKDDIVWVVCTPDCTQGYVIGRPSIFTENMKYVKGSAYNFDKIKEFLQQRQALPNSFEYQNIVIDKCVMTKDGGICEGYDRTNGNWFLLNSSGAVITVQQEKIYIRVGSPPNPISAGPAGFSAIEMTTDGINIKTPNFNLDSDNVVLGHHGMKLAGMMGSFSPNIGTNGVPVIPISTISI